MTSKQPTVTELLVALTDREFGTWAVDAWPQLSTAVLELA